MLTSPTIVAEVAEPLLSLHGKAQAAAGQLGRKAWALSLSHTHEYALASVVAMG